MTQHALRLLSVPGGVHAAGFSRTPPGRHRAKRKPRKLSFMCFERDVISSHRLRIVSAWSPLSSPAPPRPAWVPSGREQGSGWAAGWALPGTHSGPVCLPVAVASPWGRFEDPCTQRSLPLLRGANTHVPQDLKFLENCLWEEVAIISLNSTVVFLMVESQTHIQKP